MRVHLSRQYAGAFVQFRDPQIQGIIASHAHGHPGGVLQYQFPMQENSFWFSHSNLPRGVLEVSFFPPEGTAYL